MDVSTRPEGTEAVARRASRSGRVPDAATEGIVCHSLAIPSLAVASTTHRICASGFVHSRIAALRSRSTSACFSHRPSDAHLLLSVARHDLLARAQLFFVFGFDPPRDSANSLKHQALEIGVGKPSEVRRRAMPIKNPRRRGLRRLGPGPHRRRDFWLGGGRAHRGWWDAVIFTTPVLWRATR